MKTVKNNRLSALSVAALCAVSLAFTGCKDDDDHHHPHQDNELITTLKLRVVNMADSTDTREIVFSDPDGEGGQNGTITPDSLRLRPSATYRASLQLLNESDMNNIEDLTGEIEDEGNEHQFFYTPLQGLSLTVTNFDLDANQLPLGLKADFITGAGNSSGSLRISLSHYDHTPKNGITPSGETDIEVVFPVSIRP